ncbi:hypothetical protein AB0B45_25960 [Nonomuraea sp. NPDC049152]|uniref:hypothetical protein n=1 Tax=Nonomuraea sp. NPDC049152 TaxID=3154350 RepID=UPI0033F05C26
MAAAYFTHVMLLPSLAGRRPAAPQRGRAAHRNRRDLPMDPSNDKWLATSVEVPKLLLAFAPGPGTMMHQDMIDWCAANMASLEIRQYELIAGHHTPEDHPQLIADAIATWADAHTLR